MKTTLPKTSWLKHQKKPKIKESAYYAHSAQEIATSEKDFIITVSRDVDGYWSFGDEDDVSSGRNMFLIARETT